MTIRFLAQELYRLTRKVEGLEAGLAALEEGGSPAERARLEGELFRAKKELEHCRSVLEAKKEKPLV